MSMLRKGILMICLVLCVIVLKHVNETYAAVYTDENMLEYIINHTDKTKGIGLENEYSGRAMNVAHGRSNEGAVIDTYPYVVDDTYTQRWIILKSEKGVQLRSLVKDSMGLDVSTNGTGIPAAGRYTALYTPTSDDCSFWNIKTKVNNDLTISICFESKKTSGIYVGYTKDDLDNKGKKRYNFILKTECGADCWFKVINPDGSYMKVQNYLITGSPAATLVPTAAPTSIPVPTLVPTPVDNSVTPIVTRAPEITPSPKGTGISNVSVDYLLAEADGPIYTIEEIKYDREAAVKFARKAYNTSYQACTSLASCSLYKGGITNKESLAEPTGDNGSFGLKAKIKTVGALYNFLINNGYAETVEPEFVSKYEIKMNGKIQPGDILMVKGGNKYYHNAVITSVELNDNGNIIVKFCQRNVSRKDKKLYKSWSTSWAKNAKVYVLHIKNEVKTIDRSSEAVQVRLDNLLRKIYYRNHDKSEIYNEKNIGYFTVNGEKCTKHTTADNACSNCKGEHYFDGTNAWFKTAYKILPSLDNSVVTGESFSCCSFAFFCMDYIIRESSTQIIRTKNQRQNGTLNLDFIKKYVLPGDVLFVDNYHYVIVYDVNLDNNTITVIQSNIESDSKGHNYVFKSTYNISKSGTILHFGCPVVRYRGYVS